MASVTFRTKNPCPLCGSRRGAMPSRIKRALSALRTVGSSRNGNVFESNGLEAFQVIQLLKILNPAPKKRGSR